MFWRPNREEIEEWMERKASEDFPENKIETLGSMMNNGYKGMFSQICMKFSLVNF
jgi:hypothetical protein